MTPVGDNKISVSILQVGGKSGSIAVENGSTVGDVLEAFAISPDSAKTIMVNNITAHLEDVVHANDSIYVVPNVEGNC